MPDMTEGLTLRLDMDVAPLRKNIKEATSLSVNFGNELVKAFDNVAFQGKKASDVFKSFALSLSRQAFGNAVKPLTGVLNSAVAGLFQSSASSNAPASSIVPFARGGVVDGPTLFPFNGGKTGVMGEAGREAILPLARGSDGKLGVRAGAAGQSQSIIFNISTPDVDGFRRSESQISALVARAVNRGSRNL